MIWMTAIVSGIVFCVDDIDRTRVSCENGMDDFGLLEKSYSRR